ncbi:hypothetical protein PFISCL1PPCAC_14085, partial [Pristionchus fissidentatus]
LLGQVVLHVILDGGYEFAFAGRLVDVSDLPLHVSKDEFHRIHVRALRRPRHHLHTHLLQRVLSVAGGMRRSVVVCDFAVAAVILEGCGLIMRLDDFHVLDCINRLPRLHDSNFSR